MEPSELLPAAQRLAGRIAAACPSAVFATLRALRDRLPWAELEAAARAEAAAQAVFFKQEDCKEGGSTVTTVWDHVLARRPPGFKPIGQVVHYHCSQVGSAARCAWAISSHL